MVLESLIRDPEKNLFRIPDPRSMGQKGTGSRIRISNTVYNAETFILSVILSVKYEKSIL
jgi:hypothetical protein